MADHVGFIDRQSPEAESLWRMAKRAMVAGADYLPVRCTFTNEETGIRTRFNLSVPLESTCQARIDGIDAKQAFLSAYYEMLREGIRAVNG